MKNRTSRLTGMIGDMLYTDVDALEERKPAHYKEGEKPDLYVHYGGQCERDLDLTPLKERTDGNYMDFEEWSWQFLQFHSAG